MSSPRHAGCTVRIHAMNPHDDKKRAGAKIVLRLYIQQLLKYRWLFVVVLLGGIGLQAANIAAPLFLRQFFNELASAAPGPEAAHALFGILFFVALMWLADWAARRVQDLTNMYIQSRVMHRLFEDAFGYLLGHSYDFFISNFAGSLTHKVSRFARAFELIMDSIVIQFFPTFLFVVGAVTVLYMRNAWLGIALALWSVVFIWFQIWASRKRQHLREARSQADTKVTGTLADAISNHATIVLFSGSTYEQKSFSAVVDVWRKATMRSWLADAWLWSGIGLFMLGIEVGLLGGAIILWERGILTLGDFVLIQSYLMVTFDRLISINRELRRLYDAFADAGEMAYILGLPHSVPDHTHAQPLAAKTADIVFKDVDFYFNSNRPILERFDMQIRSGEKTALVGPSGAGKSTITKLLLRLYDVKGGAIEIGGQNIAEVTQDSLREKIAFVPQEPVLFHRTLLENIRYGRRDATDEEVIEAAKQAHCHEFISQLPEQYETYVGERGIKLSGGERQRVAIARAILKNAPILLLDEATSSLDSESEHLIQDALEKLMEGKTVIVIAHRLSTIMKMDRIIVLEHGRIAAEGTHADLLKQGGLYHKLWSIQAGGFIADEEEPAPEEGEFEEEEAEFNEEKGLV